MPILRAEPDYYPPGLWDEARFMPRPAASLVWWCLHSKPRQEKAVGRDLRRLGLSFYLPQIFRESRTPRGRKIRSLVPLFPSYLFLFGDHDARLAAIRSNRLVSVLEVADQTSLDKDLRQIHVMLSSGLAVGPVPTSHPGSRVRICAGPLTGVEGTVIRRGRRDQFLALVRFLGRGAVVNLEDWQVEQILDSRG